MSTPIAPGSNGTRSLRYTPTLDGDVLLVGGNDHTVGRVSSPRRQADELIEWTRPHFSTAEPLRSWSAQDYVPIDELPYVGPILPGQDHILVATGYAKWGLTNGVAAALAIAGRITGKPPAWAGPFASWRAAELRSLRTAVTSNMAVAQHLLSGWRRALDPGPDTMPAEGHGRVERRNLVPTAVCTVDGETLEVSAVCPHLGGIVAWNDAERSWDCPLHGSRFSPAGIRIEGPATESLKQLARSSPSLGVQPTPGHKP